MNKNFEAILKNNTDFIETVQLIMNHLENNKKSESEVFDNVNVQNHLKEKKLDNYIDAVFFLPIKLSGNAVLSITDINEVTWHFNIKDKNIELRAVFKIFEECNLAIRHVLDKSEISDNSNNPKVLKTFNDRNITKQEAEIVLLTYDVDISFFIDYNVDDFVFPKIDNISIKEAYKNKGFFGKLFRNKL